MLNLGLSVLSSILLILVFPRYEIAYLAPVALAPLLTAAAMEQRLRRRFVNGWVAGVVYWFGVCYWIQFVLSFHGGMGDVAGWAVFTLFAVVKALHLGVFAALAGPLMRRWWAIPAVSALWVGVEVTHGYLGFAWLALGNAGINMSVPMRLAPVTGVYGLSFIFTMTAAALALAALRRPRRQLAWVLPLPLLFALPGMPEPRPGAEPALLAQPDISETEEWTSESLHESVRRQLALTLDGAAHSARPLAIVAWPEVPQPLYFEEDPLFRGYMTNLAHNLGAHVLVGVVGHTPSGEPLNSAALVSPDGALVSRYDKVNLVPFGEFVPWPFGFAESISSQVGDFAAGSRVVVSPMGNGHSIATFICYESVFPNFVRRFAAGGAEALFNISNDGWFGKTAARWQHLSIVRMRAAENRRWILRSTNDGITAVIDAAGRIRGAAPMYRATTYLASFNYISEQTIYTRWGDWFPWVCASLALLFLVAERVV